VNAGYFVAKVLISSYIIRDLSARPLLVFLFLVRAPDLIHLYQLLIYMGWLPTRVFIPSIISLNKLRLSVSY